MRASTSLVAIFLLLFSSVVTRGDDQPWVIGLEELHRLDLLPSFKHSIKVASISSYDRSGGNDDGFSGKYSFVRKEGDSLVLADLKGPGCIYRIHTPSVVSEPIEFYFDGEAQPRISMPLREMFSGKHPPFISPIVGGAGGGNYSYVPLPYHKSCKIVLKRKHYTFYDINYATFADDAPIKTFDPKDSEKNTHDIEAIKTMFESGSDRPLTDFNTPAGAKVTEHPFDISLDSSKPAVLFQIDQPGRIVGFRIEPASSLTSKDRDVLIRITWDDDSKPAVLCPVGDFFGYAWGEPAMGGCLVGTSHDVNYCNLPMPFEHSAKIELISLRKADRAIALRGKIITADAPRKQTEGKFYAVWRRENPTTNGQPFTFVETKGRGHIVGLAVQGQGMESGKTPFFEGDDECTIDGELTIHGTGSEDFFNGGWYDVPDRWDGRFALPLSGCLAYQKHLGRSGGYRFMITDAFAFQKSILQTIEHAPEKNDLLTDYCGMTYLYCESPPTIEMSEPDEAARKVVNPKKITFAASWSIPVQSFCMADATLGRKGIKLNNEDLRYLSLRANGDDFFGPPFIQFSCTLPEAGDYKVFIDTIEGPEQGKLRLFQNESPDGEAVDLYLKEPAKAERIPMGTFHAREGENHVMFKIVGKNDASKALGFDLINLVFEREETR
jgi:hypothetical protein